MKFLEADEAHVVEDFEEIYDEVSAVLSKAIQVRDLDLNRWTLR